MIIMSQAARLVLTSYDLPKIKTSISRILESAPKFNVEIQEKPFTQKIGQFDNEPKLWGCDGKDVIRKAMIVNGSFTDMQNLVKIETPDGVLIELLSSDSYT